MAGKGRILAAEARRPGNVRLQQEACTEEATPGHGREMADSGR